MNKQTKAIYTSSINGEIKRLVSKIKSTEDNILDLTSEDKIDMVEMELLTKLKHAYVHARVELEQIVTSLGK